MVAKKARAPTDLELLKRLKKLGAGVKLLAIYYVVFTVVVAISCVLQLRACKRH